MKKQITQNIKAIILGLILASGSAYVFAGTFTGPNCAPPNCNTDAPINVGTSAQTKSGFLQIDGVKTNPADPQKGYGFVVPKGMTWLDSLVVPKTVLTPSIQITSNTYNNNAIVFTPRNEVTTDPGSSRTTLYSPLKGMLGFWDDTLKKNVLMINNGNTEVYGKIKIVGGNPGPGKVLTAKDSEGNASWETPGSGNGGGDTTNNNIDNTIAGLTALKFNTVYLKLINDSDFRAWANTPNTMPISSEENNDLGWYIRPVTSLTYADIRQAPIVAGMPAFRSTANKLCSYFMKDGFATLSLGQFTGGDYGSDNSNIAFYWDTASASWKSENHGDDGSIDITSLICVGNGIYTRALKWLAI